MGTVNVMWLKTCMCHRFEFSSDYTEQFEGVGMKCVGRNPDTGLVEVVEIPEKQLFIGTQYHPEYNSTVLHLNPLFEFILFLWYYYSLRADLRFSSIEQLQKLQDALQGDNVNASMGTIPILSF